MRTATIIPILVAALALVACAGHSTPPTPTATPTATNKATPMATATPTPTSTMQPAGERVPVSGSGDNTTVNAPPPTAAPVLPTSGPAPTATLDAYLIETMIRAEREGIAFHLARVGNTGCNATTVEQAFAGGVSTCPAAFDLFLIIMRMEDACVDTAAHIGQLLEGTYNIVHHRHYSTNILVLARDLVGATQGAGSVSLCGIEIAAYLADHFP
jgi:hypothetical protein